MSDFYNKYPYTDFHELNLDWVIERVKKLTENWLATSEAWADTQQDWADTEQAWIDFKAYVEGYLADLDVQDEIDNKINAMILDGSFETIIRPAVISQTTVATEAWLAAHITQPTTPVVDTSLSIAGAAADAKVVGDRFTLDDSIMSSLPYIGNKFVVAANTEHWSSGDRFPAYIAQGEEYVILASHNVQIFAAFDDGTSAQINLTGTAAKTILTLGVYYNNATASPVTVQVLVIKNPVGLDLYEAMSTISQHTADISSLFNGLQTNIEGVDESVSDTMGSIGNYYYYKTICKNQRIYIKNTSATAASVNVGNGVDPDINITGGLNPGRDIAFFCPMEAKYIRFYWNGTSVEFDITIETLAERVLNFVSTMVNTEERSKTFTVRSGNNWFWYTEILKGMVVTVTNNNTYQGGFHFNDGVNDLNLGYITPGSSVTAVLPFTTQFMRCYQDTGYIDTSFTFDVEINPPIIRNLAGEFAGTVSDVQYTMGGAGSYTQKIYIPKNTLVEFTNNGTANNTINVSDGTTEINVTGGVSPLTKFWFVCPLDAVQIRCYWGDANVDYRLRFLGGNNTFVNDTAKFRYISPGKLSDGLIENKAQAFNQFYDSTGIVDSFLFFTDPHMKSNDLTANEVFDQFMASVGSFYRHTPISCVICGGDWLGNSDTEAQAVQKLSDVQAICSHYLRPFYQVVGNHDTNYQGDNQLDNVTIANIWYAGNNGKNYFEFDAGNTHFYALDTGLDTDASTLKTYDIEQLKWMARKLESDSHTYLAVVLHILWYDTTYGNIGALASEVSTMLQAFNSRSTYTVDGDTFDFSNATGLFRFVLAGHTHADADTTFGTIPVIVTSTMRKSSPTFDLCAADYGSNTFKTVRVGVGSNRSFTMPS